MFPRLEVRFGAQLLFGAPLWGLALVDAYAACTQNCPPPPSTWTQLHANESNASFNPNEAVLNFTNLQSAVQKWKIPINFWSYQSVIATADVVVAAFDGWQPATPWTHAFAKVYGATTAALQWSVDTSEAAIGAQYNGPPFAVAYGTRVCATKRTVDQPNSPAGGIWAYNAQNGAASGAGFGYLPGSGYAFMAQTSSMATPTITNGALYYARQDGGLRAVSTDSGAAMWGFRSQPNTLYLN